MKFSIFSMLKNLLRKWFVVAIALIIGAGVGFFVDYNKAPQIDYVAMVYIDQEFEEKNPQPNVNYPNTVEALTAKLMDNALLAMNNVKYMGEICESHGVDVTKIDLKSMIEFSKVSANVIQINTKFQDEHLSKSICEEIVSTLPKHLNNVILHNIDEQTGGFIVGTPDSNKIIVNEFMQPTKHQTPNDNVILSVAIYAVAVSFVAILVIVIVDLCKNKVNRASSVRSSLDAAVNDANTFADGVELCVATALAKNPNSKNFAFCCGQITNEEIEKACLAVSKNKKVLAFIVSDNKEATGILTKKSENLYVSELSNDVLGNLESISKMRNDGFKEYDVNLIIINKALEQEQTSMYCKVVDNTFISLKNKVDSLWGVHELVGKLNDNEIKIDRIFCV